jgi:hypothetical protein
MRKSMFVLLGVAINFAMPAFALSVKNLSGVQQSLVLEQGNNRQAVTIDKGETRYITGGDMMLTMPGQKPKYVKFEEEYVIWPDGKLIIQKRQKTKGGSR